MSRTLLAAVFAPLAGLFILTLGNGFFSTLVTVRLDHEGASATAVGLVSAAYYAGLVLGAFRSERLIARIGHIRAYSTFASMMAVAALGHALWMNLPFWGLLRLVAGFCMAGLFVAVESWLLAAATAGTRGRVLALYNIAFFAATGAGQFLLEVMDTNSIMPFLLLSVTCSLSILPMALTRVSAPQIETAMPLSLFSLLRLSPTGVVGCLIAGGMLAALYSLLPLFLKQTTDTLAMVARMMVVTIAGGMLLQYPIGKLSDRLDRRIVLLGLAGVIVICSIVAALGYHNLLLLSCTLFLLGGAAFTLYPVAISHAADGLEPNQMVGATQGLLLSYSVGAALSPVLAGPAMGQVGPTGFFLFTGSISLGLVFFFLWRLRDGHAVAVADHQAYVVRPAVTPVGAELDPMATPQATLDLTAKADLPEAQVWEGQVPEPIIHEVLQNADAGAESGAINDRVVDELQAANQARWQQGAANSESSMTT